MLGLVYFLNSSQIREVGRGSVQVVFWPVLLVVLIACSQTLSGMPADSALWHPV